LAERVKGEKLRERCAHIYEAAQRWWAENGVPSVLGRERFIDTSRGPVRVLEYGFERAGAPLLFNLHGGGWMLLHADADEYLVTEILKKAPVRVVSIDYLKGPDNPFPAALESSYEVIRAYARGKPVGVMGQSAGGNMAASLCLLAARRGDVRFSYQVLDYPVLDLLTDAYLKPEPDPEGMPASLADAYSACYAGDADRGDPLLSPLFAAPEELKKTPPAFVLACGIDALRREALSYAEKLKESGVPATLCEFTAMRHAFTNAAIPETAEAADKIAAFINERLA